MSGAQVGTGMFSGGRRGARFTTGATGSGEHSTVVAMGGTWIWPNENETQFLVFADMSWMQIGQSLAIDDGVHTPGVLVIDSFGGDPVEVVICAWTAVGPAGGTEMLDGAAVTLVV